MELSQEALLPLAILVTLIYEGKDEELINVANELISQKAKLKDSNEKLNPNHYAVKAIQLKEPFLIEELREGTVEGKDLRVKFRLNDIKILDVGEFTTKKEKECCVSLEFDYVKISGVYSISGSVYEQQFSGGGRADITLKQVSSEARVDHTLDEDEEPRIDRLHFDFDFKFLEFEQTGLAIKDVPNSEVKRILNSVGKLYFKQNMKTVSRKLSDSIKSRLNDILKESLSKYVRLMFENKKLFVEEKCTDDKWVPGN